MQSHPHAQFLAKHLGGESPILRRMLKCIRLTAENHAETTFMASTIPGGRMIVTAIEQGTNVRAKGEKTIGKDTYVRHAPEEFWLAFHTHPKEGEIDETAHSFSVKDLKPVSDGRKGQILCVATIPVYEKAQKKPEISLLFARTTKPLHGGEYESLEFQETQGNHERLTREMHDALLEKIGCKVARITLSANNLAKLKFKRKHVHEIIGKLFPA